jgi:hypothetical protein
MVDKYVYSEYEKTNFNNFIACCNNIMPVEHTLQ